MTTPSKESGKESEDPCDDDRVAKGADWKGFS